MKPGDIVLIPFPFTDLSGTKVRPALVLSNEKYNTSRNILVSAISSTPGVFDLAIPLSQNNLLSGTLTKNSFIRMQNIFTIEKRLIIETVAICSHETFEEVKKFFLKSVL